MDNGGRGSEKQMFEYLNKLKAENNALSHSCDAVTRRLHDAFSNIYDLDKENKKLRDALDRIGLLAKNLEKDPDISRLGFRIGCDNLCQIAIEALKDGTK